MGVAYLNKAGYSSEYFVQLLEVFREKSGEEPEEASYFSTHPTNEARMQQIMKLSKTKD